MKNFFHTLLHAAYGGATTGLFAHAASGGPITLKTVGIAVAGGVGTAVWRQLTSSEDHSK